MAYLDPPPFPAPVVVLKDVGGVVSDYEARTEQYRREGREVRLHECRSACTMALSLPNVCVYPTSVLKVHKAYDWNTKVRDEGVSAQLFAAYPEAVQARLGGLTTEYRALTGVELIGLGVRDCNADQIQIARAKPSPAPSRAGSDLFGTILAALTPSGAHTQASAPSAAFAPVQVASALPAPREATGDIPVPPARPADLDAAPVVVAEAQTANIPLPPRRPADLAPRATGLPKLISGAQPTLPYGVLSYTSFGR